MKPASSPEAKMAPGGMRARASRLDVLIGKLNGGDSSSALFRQLARGFMGIAGLKVVAMGLNFIATSVLARYLGPADFGLYSLALATATLISVPTELGLARLVVRDVAKYHVLQEWGLMRGLIVRANQGVLAVSIFCCAGFVAWELVRSGHGNRQDDAAFAIALVLVPIMTLGRLREGVLRGLNRIVQGNIPETLVRPGLFVFLIGVALIFMHLKPWSALALNVASAFVAFMAGAWMLLRHIPQEVRDAKPQYQMRHWLGSLLPLSLIGGLDAINTQADLVVLGIYRGASDVGAYRTASLVAMQIGLILTLMAVVLTPIFSRMYYSGRLEELWRLARSSTAWVTVASLPPALICILFSRSLLSLLFGPAYGHAHVALIILSLGQIVNVLVGTAGLILNMTGHEKDVAWAAGFGAVTNLALNFVLVPHLGMNGSACATAISLAATNLLLMRAVKIRLGILMLPWPARAGLYAAPVGPK